MTHSRLFLIALGLLALSACSSRTELQQDQSGSDEMLKSPCACTQLDYAPPTIRWRGAA